MTRINALRSMSDTNSVAWGKALIQNAGPLVFAAVLILCSLTVGCSSDQPKPASSNSQIPATQAPTPAPLSPSMMADNKPAEHKPATKKVVHKKPATVNYTDKTYGVTFEYPRRYAIETGNAATDLLESSPIPMNFVQPGGVALAAVELPETSFANTDYSFAFFNVSVHKNLTPDLCNEFAVPQPKVVDARIVEEKITEEKPVEAKTAENSAVAKSEPGSTSSQMKPDAATSTQSADAKPSADAQPVPQSQPVAETKLASSEPVTSQVEPQGSKLLLGDLELRGTEAVSGEGTRQSDSKYFHVYQNGACYEFAMNVTTVASEDGLIKHVDRDKVFDRLEKILSTVKINPVAQQEVTAETPTTLTAPQTPAQ